MWCIWSIGEYVTCVWEWQACKWRIYPQSLSDGCDNRYVRYRWGFRCVLAAALRVWPNLNVNATIQGVSCHSVEGLLIIAPSYVISSNWGTVMFGAPGIKDGSEFCGSPERYPMSVASVTNSSGRRVVLTWIPFSATAAWASSIILLGGSIKGCASVYLDTSSGKFGSEVSHPEVCEARMCDHIYRQDNPIHEVAFNELIENLKERNTIWSNMNENSDRNH